MSNKLYFSKWLPVEGEIKQGDWMIGGAEDESFGQVWQNDNHFISPEDKKVKLFLCTRDIKVGDSTFSFESNGFGPIGFHECADIQSCEMHNCISVIGEILTPGIKEGQEFTEKEIQNLTIKSD